ncbi:MAG: hypothetical protein K8W52_47065 [Deltaproteobacteria bacterium]|nr:hypothetical protein [Deltaproteobacteria bacterium]
MQTAQVWRLMIAALGAALSGCAYSNPEAPAAPDRPDAALLSSTADGGSCPPPLDPSTLTACCPMYGDAHCVPDDRVPVALRGSLEACESGGRCVPDPIITGAPARTCTSIGGVAGACTSLCVTQVANAAAVLPQDICEASERCAPCVNPTDGTSTGACAPACTEGGDPDPGTGPDAGAASRCCSGYGSCVASAVVGDRAAQLGVDTCVPDQGLVCVPDVYLDGSFTPPSCHTGLISLLFGDAYKPGACLPACIPAVQQALFVGQDDCGANFRCLPCKNPSSTPAGQSTGACEPM